MRQMIGAYGITYKKNSHYIYKIANNSEGFFLRRSYWLQILETISVDETDNFSASFKKFVRKQYENKIDKRL